MCACNRVMVLVVLADYRGEVHRSFYEIYYLIDEFCVYDISGSGLRTW